MSAFLEKLGKAVRHPGKVPPFLWRRIKQTFLWDHYYAALPEPKRLVPDLHAPGVQERIVAQLKQAGFTVVDYEIDLEDFRRYLSRADYSAYPYYGGGRAPNFVEKALEHYVAAKLLGLAPEDTYLDIAAADSPAADIYAKLFGCRAFRQDLIFPAGLKGNRIGSDATALPVEDGFASRMSLHCSFEHFEGDADIRFLQEVNRVLRPGGRLCILPLYLSPEYANMTDPVMLPRGGMAFDSQAVVYAAKGWGNRFGRLYDVPRLDSRVRANLWSLELTIHMVRNEKEVDPSCYLKYVALLEKREEPPRSRHPEDTAP